MKKTSEIFGLPTQLVDKPYIKRNVQEILNPFVIWPP